MPTVKEAFDAARDLTGEDRIEYLKALDEEVRLRVERLLKAGDDARDFLEPPDATDRTTEHTPSEEDGDFHLAPTLKTGGCVGPFVLVRKLGEGGMGEVWAAEQHEPVKRTVALKLIRGGHGSARIAARFEAERQAIALMEHPNIARLYDVGQDGGLSYFVMELVEGQPITDYCDTKRLTPRERLDLFASVCRAVQHAHQKGIIHRDLKPGNILVSTIDGRAVPKVIDFGVAKATERDLETSLTEAGVIIGTLQYMSPEQAEASNKDIDTRSDVYSLGVVLYELLTGTPPLEKSTLKQAALFEMLRVIREVDPPKPSDRLSSTSELPSIAANRGLEPKRLSGLVRGDLDWIVMRALEKDRNRRYSSADAMARDLQRYLADEPVEASPPSRRYRIRKFVRRNRVGVMAASAVVVALVAGIAGTTHGLLKARAERDDKEIARQAEVHARTAAEANLTLARKAVDDCFTLATTDPALKGEHQLLIRKLLLERALPFYEGFKVAQADDPTLWATSATNYSRIAECREALGKGDALAAHEESIAHLRRLIEVQGPRPEHRNTLAVYILNRGTMKQRNSDLAGAYTDVEEARGILESILREQPDNAIVRHDLAAAFLTLGAINQQQQNNDNAIAAYTRCREISDDLREKFPDERKHALSSFRAAFNEGNLHLNLRRDAKALECFDRCAPVLKPFLTESTNDIELLTLASSLHNGMGIVQQRLGRFDDARISLEAAHAMRSRLAANYPQWIRYRYDAAISGLNLGTAHQERGEDARARELLEASVNTLVQLHRDHATVLAYQLGLIAAHVNLGHVLRNAGTAEEEMACYERAGVLFQDAFAKAPKHPLIKQLKPQIAVDRGLTLERLGRREEAIAAFEQALAQEDESGRNLILPSYAAALARNGQLAKAMEQVGKLHPDAKKLSNNGLDLAAIYSLASAEVKDDERERLAKLAIDALKMARPRIPTLKARFLKLLESAPEFAPIRSQSDFQTLLASLRM